MLRIFDSGGRPGGAIHRRELLRVGGLNALGLSLPTLLRAKVATAATGEREPLDLSFGRAKNVIFLWLQGGPPQHETFDPKPDAPAEIWGEFRAIPTAVPGTFLGEHLPRLARLPTRPWATRARYTPGQVWCPAHVDRADVDPRPLSELVPSCGLAGRFSSDEK